MQILLVTSRETRRWVIPKDNPESGLAPHVAAAGEAEEEAGVCDQVCPTPLGSYRYRKKRGSGASLMIDVDVFPMMVTRELPAWKEQAERERRWFTLGDAASAVDEPDLRELMRSFSTSGFKAAARRGSILTSIVKQSRVAPMFAWFQRLLPKTDKFFELFEAHLRTTSHLRATDSRHSTVNVTVRCPRSTPPT